MLIDASTRPRNLKRGVSMKKLSKALGFEKEVGLHEAVGRLELSAEQPSEFRFLAALF